MSALPPPVARLIQELTKLPGIGEKTATRLTFHLLRTDRRDVELLAERSSRCGRPSSVPCAWTSPPTIRATCAATRSARPTRFALSSAPPTSSLRTRRTVQRRYHVLHGCLAPLNGVGPEDLRVAELLRRFEDGGVREVVIATNPTVEGEATALYLARLIKPLGATGHAHRARLADGCRRRIRRQPTLGKALEGRREMCQDPTGPPASPTIG